MKKRIRVFPDFLSSGLWEYPNGANLDESEVAFAIPQHLMIALKYWHRIWEVYSDNDYNPTRLMEQWHEDGQAIVDAMNECQQEFEFIYEKDAA